MSFIDGIKRDYHRWLEESRWRRSGDYDKCFWACVQEHRNRPDASADNQRWIGDLSFAASLPGFLAGDVERLRGWVKTARDTYGGDPLVRIIVGHLLTGITYVAGDGSLEIDRLCLLAEAYAQISKREIATGCYQRVLKDIQRSGQAGYEQHVEAIEARLRQIGS